MAKLEIEISSKAVEKGLEIAKGFLDKLITPAIEETGLLLKDQISLWRLKNQVKILNKSKEYCHLKNINPNAISLKLLVPLLENASLEEDEILQDKWAYLLGNMVDSQQNVDNHVFPYLLSQLSIEEFTLLELVYWNKFDRTKNLNQELDEFKQTRPILESNIKREILIIDKRIDEIKKDNLQGKHYIPITELRSERHQKEKTLKSFDEKDRNLRKALTEAEYVPSGGLKEYQLSNLIRLGVVKSRLLPYSKGQTLEIPNDPDTDYLSVSFEVEIESDLEELYLTELGDLFIKACNEKQIKSE